MAALRELTAYIDDYLSVRQFRDYCPNGLQVEGAPEVRRLMSGVTACLDMLEAAIAWRADAVLVHHGYFWKGETPAITGMKARRIKRLLEAGVSLLAYHLPLDAHPEVGNNAQLAARLGARVERALGDDGLTLLGALEQPAAPAAFAGRIARALDRPPLWIDGGGTGEIKTVAWCTGAAQDYIGCAVEAGADAFVSGEVSERTTHIAREEGVHYFAAGHHATERYGVQALGAHLAERFGLEHRFVDIENPV